MKDNRRLIRVENDMVKYFWPNVKHMLMKSLEYGSGEFGINDLHDWVMSDTMQLWLVMDLGTKEVLVAGITEIVRCPNLIMARIVSAGGKSNTGLYDFLPEMEKHCRLAGYDYIEVQSSRDGMIKKLCDNGFEKHYTIVRKKIGE